MFGERRRRSKSSNIKMMQLFHELKQQFPTVPDHIVSACIATHNNNEEIVNLSRHCEKNQIYQILQKAAQRQQQNEELSMGHSTTELPSPSPTPKIIFRNREKEEKNTVLPRLERNRFETRKMNEEAIYNDEKKEGNNVTCARLNNSDVVDCVKFSKRNETVSVCETSSSSSMGNSRFYVKRPNYLDIKPETKYNFTNSSVNTTSKQQLQLSEKCNDVHKLLNSARSSDKKPPKSPLSIRRLSKISSPTQSPPAPIKKETASTPTQTTDTLLGGGSIAPPPPAQSPNVNLSLNVNCCMDLLATPNGSPTSSKKRSTMVQLTPHQPWLMAHPPSIVSSSPSSGDGKATSPRSYTSVNLTLRPPSSEPQAPIDITSQNSSLTYSTSSFDSEKGLQSRLQITVGPGGSGNVSSIRTRPRTFYLPQEQQEVDAEVNLEDLRVKRGDEVLGLRQTPKQQQFGSLVDREDAPVIIKQEARLERLRIELRTDKTRLEVMQSEIAQLEKKTDNVINVKTNNNNNVDDKIEEQLIREIKHLQYQCEQLAIEADKSEFYQNIYTGQRVGNFDYSQQSRTRGGINQNNNNSRPQAQQHQQESGWNCNLCTFLNHPDLDECEQCQNRIVHVSAAPGDNIHIHVTPRLSRRIVHSWVL